MDYFISFLEGIVTFVSPCLLPMIPVYAAFFAGQDSGGKKYQTARNALGFVLGFTAAFVLMGAFAGTVGAALHRYSHTVEIVSGIVMALFGLFFLGVLQPGFFSRSRQISYRPKTLGFFRCMLFGFLFSIGWTPCVGAFLGSALLLAASRGSSTKGIAMLLCYSAGLGVPFFLSAVFIGRLKRSFDFIRRHSRAVSAVSGGLLIAAGLMTAFGVFGTFSAGL